MKIANQTLVFPESSRSRRNHVPEKKPAQSTQFIALPVNSTDKQSYPVNSQRGPYQQRAIDFYNITNEISKHGGDGELIGVDTYA